MSDSQLAGFDVQVLADDLPFHLPPEALKARLVGLIRRYVQQRSALLGQTVVQHLEALYLHPALRDQEADLRHCARHWRWLAAQCGASGQDPAPVV